MSTPRSSPGSSITTDPTRSRAQSSGTCSLPETVFLLVSLVVGLGFLALPWCLSHVGLVTGIGCLILITAIMCRTAKLLCFCLEDKTSGEVCHKTYGDLAFNVFGRPVQTVVGTLFVLELLGACVAILVLAADNLALFLPQMHLGVTSKLIVGILMWLTTFLDMRRLALTSLLGVCASVALVFSVIYDGLSKREPPGSLWHPAQIRLWPSSWQAVMVVGIMTNCLSGHSVIPSIFVGMRDRKRINMALSISFGVVFSIYASLAATGYVMFGDETLDIITKNLALLPHHNVLLNKGLTLLMVIIPVAKFPLIIEAATLSVYLPFWNFYSTKTSWLRKRQTDGQFARMSFAEQGLVEEVPVDNENARLLQPTDVADLTQLPPRNLLTVIRTLLVLFSLAVAITFPLFIRVLALIGSLLSASMSIVFPAACHLKLNYCSMRPLERIADILILLIGCCMAVFGTLASVWVSFG